MSTAVIESLRLFAALPLPDELVARLLALQRDLDRHWPPRSVRWVRRDQLHLTLRFYGDVAAADVPSLKGALRDACLGAEPLSLRLCGLGGFPDARQPRVVWAGVSGDVAALGKLQASVETTTGAFGVHQETRAFQPHLTLGRVGGDRGQRPPKPTDATWNRLASDDLGRWTASAIHLIQSQLDPAGARYTLIDAVSLEPLNSENPW